VTILDNWTSVFPAEQLYVGLFDDIANCPRKLLASIFFHIGVSSEVDWDSFPLERHILPHVKNTAKVQDSAICVRPGIRRFLEEMYYKEIERLQQRLGTPSLFDIKQTSAT
jgi:hypothetical protein